jgi:regulator of CtrA degradation
MPQPATINPHIVESLYCEALVLSDEVRMAFAPRDRGDDSIQPEDLARVALSCEALRTTTRMMHALAWLLNNRAYFMGELTEFQLRRHSRLPVDYPEADPDRKLLLAADVCALIEATEAFYARLVRLELRWRSTEPSISQTFERLEQRLAVAGSR